MPVTTDSVDRRRRTIVHSAADPSEPEVFQKRSPTRVLHADAGLPEEIVERLWSAPDGLLEAGTTLKAGNRCTVVRIDSDSGSWVLKRYNLRGPVHTAVHAVLPSRASRCWQFGRRLVTKGVATPRPAAYVENRIGPLRGRSYLLTEAVDAVHLGDYLRDPERTDEERNLCAGRVASLFHQLAHLRITHGDTKSTNFLVDCAGRVLLIDLDAMRAHRSIRSFEKGRRRDRQRFFQDWRDRPEIARTLRQAINRGGAAVSGGRHDSTHRTQPVSSTPAIFRVNRQHAERLAFCGIESFSSLFDARRGTLLRIKDDRENWRVSLSDSVGRTTIGYLKKHRKRSLLTRLEAILGTSFSRSPARIECERIQDLKENCVPTLTWLAWGERRQRGGVCESFLLTDELTGYEQLDEFFPVWHRESPSPERVAALIDSLAEVARRVHDAGFTHRDFYTCHFFVKELSEGDFDVRLIDLQRVERRRLLRRRWVVHDLAQFIYSAPREFGAGEWSRFWRRYFGVDRLSAANRRLVAAATRWANRLEARKGPYL